MSAEAAAIDAPPARAFWLWHAGVPVALALLLLVGFELSDADRALTDLFFDPVGREFPLRYDPFLEVVMHRWAKYVIVLIGLGALGGCLLSFFMARLRARRRMLLFVFLAMVSGPALVGHLKDVSNKHCPYDLEIYGGFAPYTRLLEPPAASVRPGRCFPGGHSSGGFALMAFYFVWFRARRRWAHYALLGGFACGFVLGFGRLLQGAHFLSHNLWAAILCWLAALIVYRLVLYPQHRLQGALLVAAPSAAGSR